MSGRRDRPSCSLRYFTESDARDIFRRFCMSDEFDQFELLSRLIDVLDRRQQGRLRSLIDCRLQRDMMHDLLRSGFGFIGERVLSFLDAGSLLAAEHVSRTWRNGFDWNGRWEDAFLRRVASDAVFRSLAGECAAATSSREDGGADTAAAGGGEATDYRLAFGEVLKRMRRIAKNWEVCNYTVSRVECQSEHSKGVYCLQYDGGRIVCGLRDRTMKVWRRCADADGLQTATYEFSLTGHTGSVLCLQYCDDIVISGSSDATIRIWRLSDRRHLRTIVHHAEAVLHLRFDGRRLVSSSKDRTLAVFDLATDAGDLGDAIHAAALHPHTLQGHRAAVNVVDFDERYIVSASGDRTIRLWDATTMETVKILNGHKRGIACLHYNKELIISGSSDNAIRIWNVASGECLRVLEGHNELVRCVRFDQHRIISGAYDGIMKIWDLKKALSLQPKYSDSQCCTFSERVHAGRIFRLQFDYRLIMSSAHDDTIAFIDFDQ